MDGNGRRCHQANWHARKIGSKVTTVLKGKKRCRDHLVDPEGVLWARDKHNEKNNDWFQLKYELEEMKKGEIKKSAFRSLAKKFGVSY